MQICRELGGYSYGRADLVRRAMSKKKHDVMEKERAVFVEGALKNGVPREIGNQIFDEMSAFASYAFNKSHAAAYAMVSYQTAYLKCHYPKEFMAALLTSVLDNTSKVIEYIGECNRIGIKVLPPDVNTSGEGFTVSGENIRFGLLAVKNIGRGFIHELINERQENGKFESFIGFCERMYGKEMNKRALESLIKSGALDFAGNNRNQMLSGYEAVIDDIDAANKRNISGQINLFDIPEIAPKQTHELPKVEEMPSSQLLAMEKETTGLYISGHPLARYQDIITKYRCTLIADITSAEERASGVEDGASVKVTAIVNNKKLKTTRNGEMMAFVQIEDTSGGMETLIFPKVYSNFSSKLVEGTIVVITGRVSIREEEDAKLLAESVTFADEYEQAMQTQASAKAAAPARKAPVKYPGLYLRIESSDAPVFDRVKNLLSIFNPENRGEMFVKVYFYFCDTKKYNIAARSFWVDYNEVLDRELKKLLGEANVVYRV